MNWFRSLIQREDLTGQVLRGFLERPFALLALVVTLLILLAALFAPLLAPHDPYNLATLEILDNRSPPGHVGTDGRYYFLGTDGQGRDVLSAMLYGLRTSLGVGVLAGLIAIVIGTVLGLIAAYFGGWLDTLIMRVVDLMLGFPTILVALILLAILGTGVDKVILALVLVQWSYFARTVRSAALSERNREYIEAARCLGLGSSRIVFRHLLPNCLPPLIVIGTIQVANAISIEATLSFLGLGVPITQPSLGLLIANGYQYLMSGQYWISVFPGILLAVTIFAINIVGDRLREVLNPRLQ
ncbi:MAG: ABC transporter permease [Wenzhouxiangella sp.]|nr:ABC transporter permease [Wenzhouxiangella sp.]MCH8478989.1 ABC transporter permease [Wenzhouxiangella sp.]